MNERDALLAAVLAQPDEDLPRLVFADWLEEHGEVDRATFIRAQIEAKRAEPFSLAAQLADQQANLLLIMNWDQWVTPLGDSVRSFRFGRGFIDELTVEPSEFRTAAPILLAAHPIQELKLTHSNAREVRGGFFAPLFQLPCLAQVRRLSFPPGTEFQEEDYLALAGSPYLAGLRDLAIIDSPIDPPWLSSLLEGSALPELAGLALAEASHLRDALAKSLPRASHRQLRRLDISGIPFTSEQLQRVLASRCLGTVEELRLGWTNRYGGHGPLFHLTISWVIPWERLMLLDLSGQRLGDEVVHQIADRPDVAPLRWLGLADNALTHEGAQMLIRSRYLNLNYLDVRDNKLNVQDVLDLKARFPHAVVVG